MSTPSFLAFGQAPISLYAEQDMYARGGESRTSWRDYLQQMFAQTPSAHLEGPPVQQGWLSTLLSQHMVVFIAALLIASFLIVTEYHHKRLRRQRQVEG